ncbi:MAG: type III-B CRISPR module-associated protein Cmr5 [Armatimonadota bacterium]|nr:type III-B CRISPR module-associated protein Cmr5 [Armatimonadota bacterium]
MSRQRSLEQERAKGAWSKVKEVAKDRDIAEEYAQLAKSAPADIQSNGLGQTLAFWRAKKGGHHKKLGEHVSEWVMNQMNQPGKDLLDWIVNEATTNDYRRATAEAIAFLNWVKRFATAELGGE